MVTGKAPEAVEAPGTVAGVGGHKGMGSGCPPPPANIDNVGEVVDEINKPAGTKLPHLARRNLRDKGDCLPRKRGPDKLSMS